MWTGSVGNADNKCEGPTTSKISPSPAENQSTLSIASVARLLERMGGTPRAASEGLTQVPNNGIGHDARGEGDPGDVNAPLPVGLVEGELRARDSSVHCHWQEI